MILSRGQFFAYMSLQVIICYVNTTFICFYTLGVFVSNQKKRKRGLASHLLASTRLGDSKGPHLSAGKGTEPIRKGHNYDRRKYKETNSPMPCLFLLRGEKSTEEKFVSDSESLLLMMVGMERQRRDQTVSHLFFFPRVFLRCKPRKGSFSS